LESKNNLLVFGINKNKAPKHDSKKSANVTYTYNNGSKILVVTIKILSFHYQNIISIIINLQ